MARRCISLRRVCVGFFSRYSIFFIHHPLHLHLAAVAMRSYYCHLHICSNLAVKILYWVSHKSSSTTTTVVGWWCSTVKIWPSHTVRTNKSTFTFAFCLSRHLTWFGIIRDKMMPCRTISTFGGGGITMFRSFRNAIDTWPFWIVFCNFWQWYHVPGRSDRWRYPL